VARFGTKVGARPRLGPGHPRSAAARRSQRGSMARTQRESRPRGLRAPRLRSPPVPVPRRVPPRGALR